MTEKLSFFDKTFFDLWLQKIFRNFASVKYQWMLLLYVPIIVGMFTEGFKAGEPFISAALGLSFLGGGFITLATSRIIARTKLTEDDNTESLDTDR